MESIKEKFKHIPGWGIDVDWENNPVYPMKDIYADDKSADWKRPEIQKSSLEIQRSNERPTLPAVFGDTLPPMGVSGLLRRYAFQFSESKYRHWLPLLLADRVNELEGVFADIKHGKIPNILAERGLYARWKYNRKKLFIDAFTVTILGIGAAMVLKKRK